MDMHVFHTTVNNNIVMHPHEMQKIELHNIELHTIVIELHTIFQMTDLLITQTTAIQSALGVAIVSVVLLVFLRVATIQSFSSHCKCTRYV